MKKLLTIVLCFVALGSYVFGQSVQEVPATDGDGNPIYNSLIQYVVADTNANGEQLHDIYKLQNGKMYFYNQSPVFNNPITLIADEPGETDETKPPKIILARDDQGEAPYEACITTYADLTVRNIAFSTTTIEGDYSWANVILVQSDNIKLTMEGCIFELSGWGMIEAYTNHNVYDFSKCHIRNATVYDSGDEWCPFFFETGGAIIDSLMVRNCTFFNLQGTVLNAGVQDPVHYFEFDHNTCVNVVKGFSELRSHLHSKIQNNIFYNVNVHGLKIEEVETREDAINEGVIRADTLLCNEEGSQSDFIMAENERVFYLKNNVYYFTDGVKDYWNDQDSVVAAPWMDERTQAMFDNDAVWPQFVESGNVELDPGFANFGGTDQMVAEMYNHRNTGTFGFFGWDPDSSLYDTEEWKVQHWAFLQWPLPEDFSYTANVTGTDGFHVGSLVYYPDELAQYVPTATAIEDEYADNLPTDFELLQNYPNPFNPSTKIKFNLSETGAVSLKIYNSIGQIVRTVLNSEVLSSGSYERTVEMSNLSSGVYFYELKQNDNVQVQKMMLLK